MVNNVELILHVDGINVSSIFQRHIRTVVRPNVNGRSSHSIFRSELGVEPEFESARGSSLLNGERYDRKCICMLSSCVPCIYPGF